MRHRPLRFESLEDRRVLATFTVINTDDAGAGSLRDAIAQANANDNSPGVVDTISFGPLFNTSQTILLTNGELAISESLTIDGPSADLLTVRASDPDGIKNGNGSRVFNIDDGTFALINVTLDGLTITGGDIGGFEVGESDAYSADFDMDADVDGNDFLIWQRGLRPSGAAPADGDADNDDDVDNADLTLWKSQYGSGASVAAATNSSIELVDEILDAPLAPVGWFLTAPMALPPLKNGVELETTAQIDLPIYAATATVLPTLPQQEQQTTAVSKRSPVADAADYIQTIDEAFARL